MKIVIAPDSMKGCLPASGVAECILQGVKNVIPDAQCISLPMADGGEGTTWVITNATGGKLISDRCHDPLMRPIEASWGMINNEIAVIEMAAASGIDRLKKGELNPMIATSFGTGELILRALDTGCRKFIVCFGGTAVNDAGVGMLMALGVKFTNSSGNSIGLGGEALSEIIDLDEQGIDPRLKECTFLLACDVSNPLTGSNGASRTFAPQKGATPEQVEVLEKAVFHYSQVIKKKKHIDLNEVSGTGAAGGAVSAFIAFFSAEIKKGFEVVADFVQLDDKIKGADLIITAEGKTDHQTLAGKVPMGISQSGKKNHVPVIILTGQIGEGSEKLYQHGATLIFSINDSGIDLETAIKNAPQSLEKTTVKALVKWLNQSGETFVKG